MFGTLRKQQILAWSVHLITASGAIFALLATLAIFAQQWQLAFIWMAVTVIIDSFDGMLARMWGVKDALPNFDGALLDNLIDYLTYVFIPALLVVQAGLLPPALALPGAAFMVLSSAYQFAQADAKTEDHFFKGFPSYWNVVALYLFLLGLNPWLNLLLVLLCAILVFVPIKYVYPSRTRRMQRLTLLLSLTWGVLVLAALMYHPLERPLLIYLSLLFVAYYVGLSIYLTKRPLKTHPVPE